MAVSSESGRVSFFTSAKIRLYGIPVFRDSHANDLSWLLMMWRRLFTASFLFPITRTLIPTSGNYNSEACSSRFPTNGNNYNGVIPTIGKLRSHKWAHILHLWETKLLT